MGRRSGGRKLPFFASNASTSSSTKRTRSARRLPSLTRPRASSSPSPASPSPPPPSASHPAPPSPPLAVSPAGAGKVGKKKAGARLWMRLDRWGVSETLHLDKGSIIRRAGLPPRDLRILGPVFSDSSSILGELDHAPISIDCCLGGRFCCDNTQCLIVQLERRRW
ncbi:Os10g0545000 [Oryza sativa Japonica Group]|uniref:Os10g0545000 protein n=1 Tax=Oryza sativa subsp. japonica TaxID=39947 RepID=A0A0P0XXS0_ORYSJ|nr:hypothetical protein EE612_052580 [Oryza sativa]BAT11895.1 Os10g0545000 [Oryza sativa Japonica Group]